jgi:cell fate regulator YaaT (PSP1 superfamily)
VRPRVPEAVGVVFNAGGHVQEFDPDGLELAWNDRVICHTQRGREYGRVVVPPRPLDAPREPPLRRVLRRATPQDEQERRRHRELAERAMRAFKRANRAQELGAKAFAAETTLDGGRVVVTFGAEERLDLRAVAQQLSREVGARVDLRQVGPREGARLIGGGGMCGEELCCTRFPSHENPITLRMAKDQDLPMNPGRITGLCGRLRCCLAFEHPLYRAFRDRAPAVGRSVDTPRGRGVVRAFRVPADAVVVRLEGADADEEFRLDDVRERARGGPAGE